MADTTPPTIAITSNKAALKAGETALITFTLSEVAIDFVRSDITVTGGTISNFSGSGTTYSATFTPLENSTVAGLVSVGNYKFSDASGNANNDGSEPDNRLALNIDTDLPKITISSSKSIFGLSDTALINFKLSEPLIDFTLSDVSVSGGLLTNFTGSGVNYTATFTPKAGLSNSGSINVAANAFSDAGGNLNNQYIAYGVYLNTNSDPQVPKLNWARLLGTSQADSARAITTAQDGSIYVSGDTLGKLFDGQSNIGYQDVFVSKYSQDGNKIWTKILGSSGYDYATAIITSIDDSLYVSGRTTGFLDGQIATSNLSAFVTKFNPDGTKVWTRLLGLSGYDYVNGIATGTDGSIYLAGQTGAEDGRYNSIYADGYVAKYLPNGTKDWTLRTGTSGFDQVNTITLGPDGSIYVAGQTDGSLDGQSNNGGSDSFITKFNPNGTKIWTRLLGSSSSDSAKALTVGADGAIYVGGYTHGYEFDGILNNTISGFISKFSTDGTRIWTRLNLNSEINSLKIGEDGAIFAGGNYIGGNTVDGQVVLGSNDVFVARYETDGTKSWTRILGSTASDNLYGLTVGADGSLFLVGDTYSDLYGEKSLGTPVIYPGIWSSGSSTSDAFLMNLSVPDNISPKVSISIAEAPKIGLLRGGESVVLSFAITEAVKDFVASDITVQGGTLSNFKGIDKTYTATFTVGFQGTTQSVSVGNGKFSDSSGNFNLDGSDLNNTIYFAFDNQLPTIAVSSNKSSLQRGDSATLTFTLSEPSTTFVASDVTVSGGTLSNFTGSSTSYTAIFTLDSNNATYGTLNVANGVFTDAAGNANADGSDTNNSITIAVDNIAPTIALSASMSALIAGDATTLTFTLSEASTNFVESDISVTGGVLSNFGGIATTYTALFTPKANSTTKGTVSVASGVFTDAAGNTNADGSDANNLLTLSVDTLLPTIAVSSNKSSLQGGDSATLTFTLSEPSTTFVASDVTVSGGTLSNFTGSGNSYAATFTLVANSAVTGTVNIANGVFTDAAGNKNTDGSDTNNAVSFSRISTITNETHTLSVIVDKNVLGADAVLLKGLKESMTFTNGAMTKHIIEYSGLTFDYSQIDSLITTVTRDGEFTAEFTKEINDYLGAEQNITYSSAVAIVGAASIDGIILSVAGADGNFVG